MKKAELKKIIIEMQKSVANDPEVKKRVEEYVRKYGTLTPEDLNKRFTI